MRCDVEQVGTATVVHFAGELTLGTAISVRLKLLRCLAEQPDALVVDLTLLTVVDGTALSVFTVVACQASLWPDTPLSLCAPNSATAEMLASGVYGPLRIFDSVASALTAEPDQLGPSISEVLLPVSGAARRARHLVTECCLRWDLPDLVGPANFVATELVANAITHARTMIGLSVSLRRYLLVAVRDGSDAHPRLAVTSSPLDPATGRGLLLVDRIAHRWGSLPFDGGKVVWAALER
ncbi:STAS domain-containing protein [Plantactinospora sp. KLBMP9567]|uniref:STAS domain-containing protein n=1 Tax=Plantactinospora sp. KLBMP9567 TaxID=3085900 RepID=UPI0029810978|nr:STAS domain-containing protein [Plantactinospora sp. KLBMP9567]MDW5327919.1 STAS domain-containing protein [Plantactinospora sp. KLBMP9567]